MLFRSSTAPLLAVSTASRAVSTALLSLADIEVSSYAGNVTALTSTTVEIDLICLLQFVHHPFYEYKFKKFLAECALGMLPSKVWDGTADATGGYIIVREDGEILCYHLFNRNEFETYLINNTKFETASTSRHEFGSIYKDNGKYYIKLNLQVRFIK